MSFRKQTTTAGVACTYTINNRKSTPEKTQEVLNKIKTTGFPIVVNDVEIQIPDNIKNVTITRDQVIMTL